MVTYDNMNEPFDPIYEKKIVNIKVYSETIVEKEVYAEIIRAEAKHPFFVY